jgi:hypothetical protein
MDSLRGKLTYANVISTIALFLVLAGGTAIASQTLAKNSVGAKQLKAGAVTAEKLSKSAKESLKGATGAQGANGAPGAAGPQGVPGQPGANAEAAATEPVAIDAEGQTSVPTTSTTVEITLSGKTEWTLAEGHFGLVTATVKATLQNEMYDCNPQIEILDNGDLVGTVLPATIFNTPTHVVASLTPTLIGIGDPGLHTLTARIVGNTSCSASSTIEGLHLVVIPLRRSL